MANGIISENLLDGVKQSREELKEYSDRTKELNDCLGRECEDE